MIFSDVIIQLVCSRIIMPFPGWCFLGIHSRVYEIISLFMSTSNWSRNRFYYLFIYLFVPIFFFFNILLLPFSLNMQLPRQIIQLLHELEKYVLRSHVYGRLFLSQNIRIATIYLTILTSCLTILKKKKKKDRWIDINTDINK